MKGFHFLDPLGGLGILNPPVNQPHVPSCSCGTVFREGRRVITEYGGMDSAVRPMRPRISNLWHAPNIAQWVLSLRTYTPI